MSREVVNRDLLRAQLQRAGEIQSSATESDRFGNGRARGVGLAAQLAVAGIGAYAQNKAEKQLAAQELMSQQLFAQNNPELAGLAGQLSSEARDQISLKRALLQTEQQFAAPTPEDFSIQKTDQGLFRVNAQTGEAFPIKAGDQSIGVNTPEPAPKANPLSGESAKILTIAKGGINAINELNVLLRETGGKVTKRSQLSPELIKTPTGRQVTLLRKDLADSIGRLRSGGAINAEELSTFNSFIPAFTDDAETVQFKLKKLGEKFNTLQSGITGGVVEPSTLDLNNPKSSDVDFSQLKDDELLQLLNQ